MKVIVWGHLLNTHTHSFVWEGFVKAAKYLGYETLWLDNTIENQQKVKDWNDVLYIVEGSVDQNIPLNKSCRYITHNAGPAKYTNLNVLKLQVLVRTNENLSKFEKINDHTYFDRFGNTLYMYWATDLTPDKFDYSFIDIPKKNVINWVGTIKEDGTFENINNLKPFRAACEKKGIQFFHTHAAGMLTAEDGMKKIQESIIAPTIVGTWQATVGFIPCRIFKTISYGQMGVTNSQYVNEVFDDRLVYNPDTVQLLEDGLKFNNKDLIKELMNEVKEKHTYVERLKQLVSFL